MTVRFHPHGQARWQECGAMEDEVVTTVEQGKRFSAKQGGNGSYCNFPFNGEWNNRRYSTKQVEAYAVEEEVDWLVITVSAEITKRCFDGLVFRRKSPKIL